MNRIIRWIKQPKFIMLGILHHCYFLFSDRFSIKLQYRLNMGKHLHLDKPEAFSEKLQWLKLYDRKDIYTKMVDKILAKEYVAEIIGQEYIIPTLGVWSSFEEIDFNMLPQRFVLKTNNSGGGCGVVICKDKSQLDKKESRRKLNLGLKNNIYRSLREWPYKNVKPMIFAEEILEDENQYGLMDYKIFCFNGVPKLIKVNYHVNGKYTVAWHDVNWNYINSTTIFDPLNQTIEIKQPEELNQMLNLASKLSQNIPFLRVDFYNVLGRIYFGELTFYPGSGYEPFDPDSFDYQLGNILKLPGNFK